MADVGRLAAVLAIASMGLGGVGFEDDFLSTGKKRRVNTNNPPNPDVKFIEVGRVSKRKLRRMRGKKKEASSHE